MNVQKHLVISIALAGLCVALLTHLQAQGSGANNQPGRGDGVETNDARGVLTDAGGIGYINPGSPTVPDNEINSQPIPRLPDGHVDLTGPWVGGGSNADIEHD